MAWDNQTLEELLNTGNFRRAIHVLETEWTAGKMNIGPDMPEVIRIQVHYADVLRMAGYFERAVEMYRDIILKMERQPELFNEEVLDVKLSLANITYRKDVKEATVLIEGLEDVVARLPMEDSIIPLKKKLAETMRDFGKYESALSYFDEIYKFKWNEESHSLDTLSAYVDIVTVYLEQGRYMKAMDILSSIYEQVKNVHPNHHCTLRAERYIADICVHYGMTLIACMKYEHISQVQSAEAPRSLETLTTLHKLSLAYLKDGRSKKALEVIEDVYNTRKVETPCHPDTSRVQIDFMMMQLHEGDASKAAFLLFSALERNSDCFDFELVVDIPRNIAMFFRKLDKCDKAEEAIKIFEYIYEKQCQMSRLGPLHPETLLTKTHIAETHLYLKNFDEALRIFEEVLHIKINTLRNDNMDCIDVRKHIAEIYYTQGNFRVSYEHYCEVYRNERMYLGAYHDVTIETEDKVDGFCLLEPETNLVRAIVANDLQSVKNFCNALENAELDVRDYYGCTPLHAAVVAGNPEIVRFLLSKGASLYVKNRSGKIPREMAKKHDVKIIFDTIMQLFMDVKLGNIKDMTEVLSLNNVDIINVRDEEGKTVLHWACQKGDIEMVNLLLNNGADSRINDRSGNSALNIAERLNHVAVVQTINRYLEEPNLIDLSLRSPRRGGGGDS